MQGKTFTKEVSVVVLLSSTQTTFIMFSSCILQNALHGSHLVNYVKCFDCFSFKVNENISFGFCNVTKKLVDVAALIRAARDHSLAGLRVCVQREAVMDTLKKMSVEDGQHF